MSNRSLLIESAATLKYNDALEMLPEQLMAGVESNDQTLLPALAKDPQATQVIEEVVQRLHTHHRLVEGDGRKMDDAPEESVHLIVTSPPYWTLK